MFVLEFPFSRPRSIRLRMPYPNQIFTCFAFLEFLLCSIPLPWHLETWRVLTSPRITSTSLPLQIGTLVHVCNGHLCGATSLQNLSHGPPSLSLLLPCASIVALYCIVSVKTVTINRAERLRDVYIDFAIGLGLPVPNNCCATGILKEECNSGKGSCY